MFKAKEKDTSQELRLEKVNGMKGGAYENKTLLVVADSGELLAQVLLTPTQIKRLHKWLGQRLVKVL
jgi:hypothetical protein